jgi:hypothetical protein
VHVVLFHGHPLFCEVALHDGVQVLSLAVIRCSPDSL